MIISEATLRPEDLVPAFLDALEELDEELYAEAREALRDWGYDPDRLFDPHPQQSYVKRGFEYMSVELSDFYDSDDASYLLDLLFDKLNEACPAGTYFSAHEGDGALFGVWGAPCDEHMDELWPLEDCEACQENVKRATNPVAALKEEAEDA